MLHQIGVGALGPVFRTYEPARDRLVAVKVFRLDLTPEQAQALADQLARSAEADLFHPAIVEPIAAGVEGTAAYRAEEYVAEESLDAAMRHYAPATLATVLRIVGQLGAGIDAARAAGVGHGGLHPRDVFVTPEGTRASGFGVVDALERVGLRAPVRRPYSAPERVAGESWDLPADVFSLAAIAFELLTGRRPAAPGADIGPLTGAQLTDPQPVYEVLVRAMHQDPDERFGTGQAFVEALASAGSSVAPAASLPAMAFADERPGSVRMIPLPAELPEFADEEDEVGEPTVATRVPFESAEAPLEDHDIVVERDEDAAHWSLALEDEAAARPESVPRPADYDDVTIAAAADTLALQAAELALFEHQPASRFSDEFLAAVKDRRLDRDGFDQTGESDDVLHEQAEPETPVGVGEATGSPLMLDAAADDPPRVIEREAWTASSHDTHSPAADDSYLREQPATTSPSFWPRALVVLAALLIAFAAGYYLRGARQAGTATAAVEAGRVPTAAAPQPSPAPVVGDSPAAPAATPPAGASTAAAPPRERTAAATPGRAGAARSGKLFIRSTPPGAGVVINGKWSGRTPLTREALALGAYTVRVTLPGFEPEREQFSLTPAASSRTLAWQLKRSVTPDQAAATTQAAGGRGTPTAGPRPAPPAPTTASAAGSLDIDSRPAGARVLVDGASVGTTPLKLPDVNAGEHVIRLELAGHAPWTQNTQVTRGRTTRVAGSLEPIR